VHSSIRWDVGDRRERLGRVCSTGEGQWEIGQKGAGLTKYFEGKGAGNTMDHDSGGRAIVALRDGSTVP
jgi:hypothetical protein